MISAAEWTTVGVGAPGAVSMCLLLYDRWSKRQRHEALDANSLRDLEGQVKAAAALAATVARENIDCANQRMDNTRRIATLEGSQLRIDNLVIKVERMDATNEEAHKSVGRTLERLDQSVTSLQVQMQRGMPFRAGEPVEIRRSIPE